MAIKPKQIMDAAVGLARDAVDRGVDLAGKLRNDQTDARPTTPASPGGPKSTTAKAKAKPRGRATEGSDPK
jgi:hypothetical protein